VFSPDGHWVTNADPISSELKIFDLSNGAVKATIPNRGRSVATFSTDGHLIALAQYSQDKPGDYRIAIDLWSVPTGNKIKALEMPSGVDDLGIQVIPNTSPSGLRAVVFSPDGKRLAAANYFIETAKNITCPSSRGVATTWYSLLKIWDVTTGREVLTLGGQTPQ
jgi:WD40 repeat protein